MTLECYTDGALSKLLGNVGGWAWWCEDGRSDSGQVAGPTTSQRMEMQAVIEGVKAIAEPRMLIVSDSAYVVNCFLDGWWQRWEANGWRKTAKGRGPKTVANRDLWEPMIELVLQWRVEFRHVRGHVGIDGNERADKLAYAAARS